MTDSRPPLPNLPASVELGSSGLRAYIQQVAQWNRDQRVKREKTISLLRSSLRI